VLASVNDQEDVQTVLLGPIHCHPRRATHATIPGARLGDGLCRLGLVGAALLLATAVFMTAGPSRFDSEVVNNSIPLPPP
jgi:hypothetical protein